MERTRLGTSDLNLSRIGLGTWAIGGGDWVLGWGPQRIADSVATIRRAIDAGINWIDTAAVFGLGHAETVIARALRDVSAADRPHVFTKCGLMWDELGNVFHDLSPRSIRAQAEASLSRLNVDRIDLYQIGWTEWPSGPIPPNPFVIEAAWETMEQLRHEGKVRHIGIANCTFAKLAKLQTIATATSIIVPYSLLRRELEKYAGNCPSGDLGIIACSTLASGLLTGSMTPERLQRLPCNDWRRRHAFFQEMSVSHAPVLVKRLAAVAARQGVTPAAMATAWALHHPAVSVAAVGARTPGQIDDIARASDIEFTPADLVWLNEPLPLEIAGVGVFSGAKPPGRY